MHESYTFAHDGEAAMSPMRCTIVDAVTEAVESANRWTEVKGRMRAMGWTETDVPGTDRTVIYHPSGLEHDSWLEAVLACLRVASE